MIASRYVKNSAKAKLANKKLTLLQIHITSINTSQYCSNFYKHINLQSELNIFNKYLCVSVYNIFSVETHSQCILSDEFLKIA